MGLPQRQVRSLLSVLEEIAEAAGCARSTVAEAIKALGEAGSSHGAGDWPEKARKWPKITGATA